MSTLRIAGLVAIAATTLLCAGVYMLYPSQEVVNQVGYAAADFDRAANGEATLPILTSHKSRLAGMMAAASAGTGPGHLEGAMVLPMGDKYTNSQIFWTYQYVWKRLHRHSTDFVNLPFAMHPKRKEGQDADPLLERGGFVRFKNTNDDWRLSHVDLYAPHDQELSSGVPLFMHNIAILKVREQIGDQSGDRDLTYSSTYFCRVMQAYIGGFRTCFLRSDYEKYLKTEGKHEENSIVYVTPEDIKDNFLYQTEGPDGTSIPLKDAPMRFGLLMIPDIILNSEGIIADSLGAAGAKIIREYVSNGGSVYVNAKGTRVAEKIGLMTNGASSSTDVLTAKNNKVAVKGCKPSELSKLPDTDASTARRMLCQSLRTQNSIVNKVDQLLPIEDRVYEQYLLSAFPVDASKLTGNGVTSPRWTQMHSFDSSFGELRLKNVRTGRSDVASRDYPMSFFGSMGEGRVIVNLIHPSAASESYFPFLLNSVLNLLSRPVAYSTYPTHSMRYPVGHPNAGEIMPFPALESDLSLTIVSEFMNLEQAPVTNVEFTIELIKQVWPDVKGLPGVVNPPVRPGDPEDDVAAVVDRMAASSGVSCSVTDTEDALVLNKDATYTVRYKELKYAIKCTCARLDGHSAITLRIPSDIIDARATAWGFASPLGGSTSYYTRAGKRIETRSPQATLAVARTPHLVGEVNLDPLGIYPLPAKGFTGDTILTLQNREGAEAYNVSFSSIVPLVAPVAIGGNQADMLQLYQFLPEYYEAGGWEGRDKGLSYNYPFQKRSKAKYRDNDYIDLRSMANKGISLVVEWDDPSYVIRESRSAEHTMTDKTGETRHTFKFNPIAIDEHLHESDLMRSIVRAGYYDAASTQESYRHQFYPDCDQFLEHANFRLMPYAMTWTAAGFKTFCEDYKTLKVSPELKKERAFQCARLANPRPAAKGTGRFDLTIQRLDAYFRTNTFYDMQRFRFSPTGLKELFLSIYPEDEDRYDPMKIAFTVDKYAAHPHRRAPAHNAERESDTSPLMETALASGVEVPGYMSNRKDWVTSTQYKNFDGTSSAARPYRGPGLFPNEWANPFLAEDTGRWVIHWDDIPALDPTKSLSEQPLHRYAWYWSMKTGFPDAVDYRDFADFKPIGGGSHGCGKIGYYHPVSDWDRAHRAAGTDYPDVQIRRAFSFSIGIPAQRTELGGEIVVKIPKGFTWNLSDPKSHPVTNNWIQWSVDHIAITDTRVETHGGQQVVIARFRRGNQSDQRYAPKPSIVSAVLIGLRDQSNRDGASVCVNEEYQNTDLTVDVSLRQLYWNFNAGTTGKLETYRAVEGLFADDSGARNWVSSRNYPLTPDVYMVLPGLMLDFPLLDLEGNDVPMRKWERFDQFTRFRSFYQDLGYHRTIWGDIETHSLHSDPGPCGNYAAFSVPTGVGIATVPFHDFVNTGTLAVPYGSLTAQVRWKDIWERHHSQPMRSNFLDVPPIPPPLRNFWMQTTFEVLDNETGERYQEWPADRPATAHVNFNVLNNYPKWFDITLCSDNSYLYDVGETAPTVFWTDVIKDTVPGAVTNLKTAHTVPITHNQPVDAAALRMTSSSKYGACFASPQAYLNGKKMTADTIAKAKALQDCSGDRDDCESDMLDEGWGLKRAPGYNTSTGGGKWNYSPFVEEFYPKDYITLPMWRLQHYDYSDDSYAKAYPYHMDNLLPSVYTGQANPDNMLSIPIWKGFGYKVEYNADTELPSMPGTNAPRPGSIKEGRVARGVWSDNLQNTDSTLIGGQKDSIRYPTGVPASDISIPESKWIDSLTLADNIPDATQKMINTRVRNGLVCLFNRDVTQVLVGAEDDNGFHSDQFVYRKNVVHQNVIPIPIKFTKTNKFYSNFECSTETPQYRWDTIREVTRPDNAYTNYRTTNDARDFMQFAFNLRGGAKENLHLLLSITPSDTAYEGDLKVFDGARFAYWNPALSHSAWLVVDSNTHLIPSIQSQLELTGEVLPNWAMTSDPRYFLGYNLLDAAEWNNGKLREFTDTYTLQNHGFGDFTTQVNCGQATTKMILQPGENYTAMVEFVNNAGFDIHFTPAAFEGTDACLAKAKAKAKAGEKPILFEYCPSGVTNSTAYNFLQVDTDKMDPSIRDKVTVQVSAFIMVDSEGDEEKGIEPVFFDLIDVNAPRIRDGFRGQYWVDVIIAEDFPRNMRGRLLDIPLKFVTEGMTYRLPGMRRCTTDAERYDETVACDPTGTDVDHDYTITVPPLKFAVPFPVDNEFTTAPFKQFAGRVFRSSGVNKEIELTFDVKENVDLNRAVFLDAWQYNEFRRLVGRGSPVDAVEHMKAFFEKHASVQPVMKYDVTNSKTGWKSVTVALNPKVNPAATFVSEIPANYVPDDKVWKPAKDIDSEKREHTPDWTNFNMPALGSMYIVFNATMPFTAFGFTPASRTSAVTYRDAYMKTKTAQDNIEELLIEVKGASLVTSFQHAVVDSETLIPSANQWLVEDEVNTLLFTVQATNDGDDTCFKVRAHIELGDVVEILNDDSVLPEDVTLRVMRNGTVEIASTTALSPGETLVLPFYAKVNTVKDPKAAAFAGIMGATSNIKVLTNAEALYELQSYGRVSAVAQPLIMDGSITMNFGPGALVQIPVNVTKDSQDMDYSVLSTVLPEDRKELKACIQTPGLCRFAWSWRYEGHDKVYNNPAYTDLPEFRHHATTGFPANVTYRVTLVRVFDEAAGPMSVASSQPTGLVFDGSISTARFASLIGIYAVLCVVLGFMAFGYETVGRWIEIENLSKSYPFIPKDTNDSTEAAVVREVNRECIRTGRTITLDKISSTEYDIGGCRLTVADLKRTISGLGKKKPKFTTKGVDKPANFSQIANQFCLVSFNDDVLAELPQALRLKVQRHSRLPAISHSRNGYTMIDDE